MALIKREILTTHKVFYNIVFASFFWSHHINSITTRVNKTLGLLCRNLNSCSPYINNVAYKPLVRLQLEYCSQILTRRVTSYHLRRYNDEQLALLVETVVESQA